MSLLTDLVAYYQLDEASGIAIDAHAAYDLTDNNTVGTAAGKINDARDFERDTGEYFSIADNADFSAGDVDFTIAAWVKMESKPGTMNIVAKRQGLGNLEYYLRWESGADRFQLEVSPDGSTPVADVNANTLGSPSTGTWYFVVAWHDASANTINIQVNDGSVDSTGHSTGVFNGTSDFQIGAGNSGAESWDGLIDEVGFWKRVLTSQERTDLYNGGSGLAYSSFGGSSIVPLAYHHRQQMRAA